MSFVTIWRAKRTLPVGAQELSFLIIDEIDVWRRQFNLAGANLLPAGEWTKQYKESEAAARAELLKASADHMHLTQLIADALTVNAFKAAFASLGFVECEDGTLEPGVEKIAIYASHTKVPRHAALQLRSGRWASKLGREADIEHDSEKGVSGDNYGTVVAYMKRPAQRPAKEED